MEIKNRYKNTINLVSIYTGIDIYSDHNPIIGDVRVKIKKIMKRIKRNNNCINIELLNERSKRDVEVIQASEILKIVRN